MPVSAAIACDWKLAHAEMVIRSTAPHMVQGVADLRTTANDKSIYVHVFNWPDSAAFEIAGIEAKVMSVRLLANGKPLTFHQTETKLQIDIPKEAPDPNVSVIALKTY